jgi:exonuclease SbcD
VSAVRVLHGADLHLGLRRFGHPTRLGNSRIDDFAATLLRFADTAIERADIAVLVGDTFDDRMPTPPQLAVVSRAVARMRDARIPVVVVPGNHDGPEIIANPDTHTLGWMAALQMPGVWVPLVPEQRRIDTKAGPIDVTAVPYPHRRSLDAELQAGDPELGVLETARRLDSLLESLAPTKGAAPTLFVGHMTATGSRLGSVRLMRSGWDVAANAEILARWDYAALGHIHYQQQVNARTWYAGSMEYIDFAETGQPKGWLLVTVDPGPGDPDVQPIRSGARPLGILDVAQAEDGTLVDPSKPEWYTAGPIVRLRVLCSYRRPTAGELAQLRDAVLAKGASYVDTELVLEDAAAEHRATRPAVDAAVAAVVAEHASESDEEASRQVTVTDLSMADALKVWLTANDRPLQPTLDIGSRMIAEQTAEGRTA